MARVVGRSSQYWSSFSPSNIPGLTLWYDFSDRSTIDLSGEYQITRIRDKSGKGAHGTPSNPADSYWIYDAVANGVLRVPTGASNNFVLDICLNVSTLCFSGATVMSGTGGQFVYVFGGKEPGAMWFRSASGAYSAGQTNNLVNSGTNAMDNMAMSVGSFTGGPFTRASANGVVGGNLGGFVNQPQTRDGIPMIIGTYNVSSFRNYGSIYELILFSNVISDSDRAAVEDYLMDKWMFKADAPATISAPTDISGCNLWLDVSGGASNFTFVPGTSNITKWIDKSPANRDVSTSSTTTNFPAWHDVSGYVYFNGSPTSALNTNRPEPSRGVETAFIVARRVAGGTGGGIINNSATGSNVGPNRQLRVISGYVFQENNLTPATPQFGPLESLGTDFTSTTDHELSWRIKGKEFFSRCSGHAAAYKVPPNWGDISAGGFTTIGPGTLNYREVVLYDRALSFSEMSNVSAYLTKKWNISNYKTFSNPPSSNRAYGSNTPFVRPFQVPYDIPNCTLWLDAKDANTIQLDSSGNVLQWLDKSGWGNDVSGGTSRPNYSNETIVFNSNFMTVRNSNLSATGFRFDPPFYQRWHTLIALHKPASSTGNTSLIDFSITGTAACNVSFPTVDLSFSTIPRGYTNNSTANGTRTTSIFLENSTTTNYNIITASIQSNRYTIYRNGVIQQDVSGVSANNSYYSGGTSVASIGRWGNPTPTGVAGSPTFYQGEVKEIFIFDRALPTYSVAQVEAYLARKWNLTSLLPSNHIVFTELKAPVTTNIAPPALQDIALWVDAMSYTGQYSNNATITTNWTNLARNPSDVIPAGTPKFLSNAWQGRPGIDMKSGSFTTTFAANGVITNYYHQTFIVASYNTGAPNTTRNAMFLRNTATTNTKHALLQIRPLDATMGTQFINSTGGVVDIAFVAPPVAAGSPFIFEVGQNAGFGAGWTTNGRTLSNSAAMGITGGNYGWAGIGQDNGTDTTPTWDGNIHEIIVYSGLSPGDFDNQFRFRIRSYLARKWGLLSVLPTYPDKGITV